MAVACIGPAPPNANSTNSRGSCPFSIETIRAALAIWLSATARIAAAASSASSPSGLAMVSTMRARTRSRSVGARSPASEVVSMRPSTALASVTVRCLAAAPVADRSGARPGALRSDPEQPAGIDPRDAAAARADGVDVDEREVQRHRVRQVLLVRDRGAAVPDEGQVEARAAHVAGEHVVETRCLAEPGGRDGAGRRAGHHRLRRGPARGAGGHHPPVALHQQEPVA